MPYALASHAPISPFFLHALYCVRSLATVQGVQMARPSSSGHSQAQSTKSYLSWKELAGTSRLRDLARGWVIHHHPPTLDVPSGKRVQSSGVWHNPRPQDFGDTSPQRLLPFVFPYRLVFAFTVMTSCLKMQPEKELMSTPPLRKQLGKQRPERQRATEQSGPTCG